MRPALAIPAIKDGAWRLGLFYALTLAGTGVSLPYISPWFKAHGLSASDIGIVLGAPMFARIVTAPLLAVWADSFRLRRTPLLILALVSAGAYLALGFSRGFGAWFLIWLIGATALGMIAPLSDVLTIRRGRREGFSFGPPRGVGSLAHVVGNVGMGLILVRGSVDSILVWMVLAAVLAALAAAVVLPAEPVRDEGPVHRSERFKGLGALVADPVFMLAIVAVGLINAAHAFYYGFASIAWAAQGIPSGVIGLLWGTGVGAEIAFLWFFQPWARKVGPWALIVFSAAGAVVRWTAFAFSPPLWVIWPLQLLHALSFTASYVGGLQLVERLSPPDNQSAAQTLSSALSGGLFIGGATILSGALYDHYGAGGYLAMAAMAAAGLVGAFKLRRMMAERGVSLI
jgi:PPP family 3-phenylpropionic acid transporter